MAGVAQVAHLWNEWGIQVLVLLSFTLQVTLLILAEFRRRVDSGVLRFFTWSAYQMADSVALYALGHMAVAGKSPDHELVALWAPFLLGHLGGQDNITAYAIEDNELWLRHLQTLAVQAAAAAYVLYSSSVFSSGSHHSLLLQVAAILMFVVGVAKYGERVWTLRYASGSKWGKHYGDLTIRRSLWFSTYSVAETRSRSDTEDIIYLGHDLLAIPKGLLKGSGKGVDKIYVLREASPHKQQHVPLQLYAEEVYKVAEVQVSLMHDVFYTKAESQRGITRLVSLLATTAEFLLLLLLLLGGDHNNNTYDYNNVDVALTCVLSVGAAVLESTSLLRYILSSFNWYRYEMGKPAKGVPTPKTRERDLCARVLISLRRLIHASNMRTRLSWSRSMGQHNLLKVCSYSKASRFSKMARWLGVEDWWNTLVCSWSVPVSPLIEQLMVKQVQESCQISVVNPDHILNSRGQAAIKRKTQKLYDNLYSLGVDPDSLSLEESVLIWHLATDLYLRWYREERAFCNNQQDDLANAIDALSNYMLFLLAVRPNMLPPSASRDAYVEMFNRLNSIRYTSAEDLANLLRRYGDTLKNPGSFEFEFPCNNHLYQGNIKHHTALKRGSQLAAELIGEESEDSLSAGTLELIGNVWVEMVCYVGNRCSGYSHAKQLSDGGELITVAAFLVEYLKIGLLKASGSTPIDNAI